MGVIKLVKEITGLGLKEAKAIVDGAPKAVKEKASRLRLRTSRRSWRMPALRLRLSNLTLLKLAS